MAVILNTQEYMNILILQMYSNGSCNAFLTYYCMCFNKIKSSIYTQELIKCKYVEITWNCFTLKMSLK